MPLSSVCEIFYAKQRPNYGIKQEITLSYKSSNALAAHWNCINCFCFKSDSLRIHYERGVNLYKQMCGGIKDIERTLKVFCSSC